MKCQDVRINQRREVTTSAGFSPKITALHARGIFVRSIRKHDANTANTHADSLGVSIVGSRDNLANDQTVYVSAALTDNLTKEVKKTRTER